MILVERKRVSGAQCWQVERAAPPFLGGVFLLPLACWLPGFLAVGGAQQCLSAFLSAFLPS